MEKWGKMKRREERTEWGVGRRVTSTNKQLCLVDLNYSGLSTAENQKTARQITNYAIKLTGAELTECSALSWNTYDWILKECKCALLGHVSLSTVAECMAGFMLIPFYIREISMIKVNEFIMCVWIFFCGTPQKELSTLLQDVGILQIHSLIRLCLSCKEEWPRKFIFLQTYFSVNVSYTV